MKEGDRVLYQGKPATVIRFGHPNTLIRGDDPLVKSHPIIRNDPREVLVNSVKLSRIKENDMTDDKPYAAPIDEPKILMTNELFREFQQSTQDNFTHRIAWIESILCDLVTHVLKDTAWSDEDLVARLKAFVEEIRPCQT